MATPQYEMLRASITEVDHRRVFDVLLDHVGQDHKVGIDEIAQLVYRSRSSNAIRKAREVIEALRGRGVPICSNSGTAGRWLAADQDELDGCIADYESRKSSIQTAINALRGAKIPATAMPSARASVSQLRLV